MSNICVFIEYDESMNINVVYVTSCIHPYNDILKKFQFKSDKSLIQFLLDREEIILESIPFDQTQELEQLEQQQFLKCFTNKWYDIIECNPQTLINPPELLDIAIKYKAVNEKEILEYISKNKGDYVYEIHFTKLN